MKLIVSLNVAAVFAFLTGCASESKVASNKSGPGHWITLEPETGSHLDRRIWVADGSTNINNSQVKTWSADDMREMQNRGNVNRGRTGQ